MAARHFGANSFGLELSSLKGTGSVSSVTTEASGPGYIAEERSRSLSDISQTRFTAGYSRELSRNVKLGLFYRYAFIHADDHDVSHTINDLPLGLNATRTTGHSSEFGVRVRGLATPRLSYGFAAAWLGISLLGGMNRIATVDSHERDRSQRGSVAVGLGSRSRAALHSASIWPAGALARGAPGPRIIPVRCCKTPSRTAASFPRTPPCRAILRAGCFSPRRS